LPFVGHDIRQRHGLPHADIIDDVRVIVPEFCGNCFMDAMPPSPAASMLKFVLFHPALSCRATCDKNNYHMQVKKIPKATTK
jgi:hypothetical protein